MATKKTATTKKLKKYTVVVTMEFEVQATSPNDALLRYEDESEGTVTNRDVFDERGNFIA